jgi:hypothetical protein
MKDVYVRTVTLIYIKRRRDMFKNWKTICQIPDVHFMWAIALLDLETDFGKSMMEKFPEYFVKQQQLGPIPLSVLLFKASKVKGYDAPENFLVSTGAIPSFWPIFKFGDQYTVERYDDFILIPEELKRANEVGKVYSWQGKRLILVENGYVAGDEWFFVPVGFIDVEQ